MRPLKPLAPAMIAWLLLSMAAGPVASAHGFDGSADDGVPGWTFEPWVTVPLAVAALLFAAGWVRLRARSRHHRQRWRRRAIVFAAGWSVVALALVSPLHAAGERSFAAHMIEHELLMLLGAPLLVLAEPLVVLLWALPAALRRRVGALLTSRAASGLWARASEPFTATALQAAALWLWHAPALFDRALASEGWHAAQHLSFVASALLFWTAMLHRAGGPKSGVAALCLFATSVVSGALGALMAMSESPWYAGYARLARGPFGLTPAQDQQLAGLFMWIPGGLVHAAVALVLVRRVLALDAGGRKRADAA